MKNDSEAGGSDDAGEHPGSQPQVYEDVEGDLEVTHRDLLVKERIDNMLEQKGEMIGDIDLMQDIALVQDNSGSLSPGTMTLQQAEAHSQKIAASMPAHVWIQMRKAAMKREQSLDTDQFILLGQVRRQQQKHSREVAELTLEHGSRFQFQGANLREIELYAWGGKNKMET